MYKETCKRIIAYCNDSVNFTERNLMRPKYNKYNDNKNVKVEKFIENKLKRKIKNFTISGKVLDILTHDNSLTLGGYLSTRDSIYIRSPRRFFSRCAYYKIVFHEFIHSTSHKSRLNRDITDKNREELIAEIGSFLLAERFKIQNKRISRSGYSMIKKYYKEGNFTKRSLEKVISESIDAVRFLIKEIR